MTADRPIRLARSDGLVQRATSRYRDHALACRGVTEPPYASLADGAAGVAYFLLRQASFGGGDASLEAAALWAAQAECAIDRDGAFPVLGHSGRAGPQRSLYYHQPGVWWVQALVAAARDDPGLLRRSGERFAAAAGDASGAPWDVSWGSAGLLLGCAQLVDSVEDPSVVAPVRAAGERLAFELVALAERAGTVPGETVLGYLGAAHGWGGIAHALLRWGSAIGDPPRPETLALLERLIALRRPSGRWPVRVGSRDVRRGWCHGSAGWAELWTLAWQVTGEEDLLTLAEQSAQDAVDADQDNASLCCGRGGQAYAALTLYRATGEPDRLRAAHRVAADALRLIDHDRPPAHRLFSGELGVVLLIAELEDAARAAMPVYQSIS